MIENVRKSLATFWWTQFLQGVIFEVRVQKDRFWCWRHINSCREQVQHVFSCRKLVSKLCFLFTNCENNFLLEIAPKCFFGRLDVEKSGSAVEGRVLRTPLGHELRKCIELSRFWHGRGITKLRKPLTQKIIRNIGNASDTTLLG